MFWVQKLLNAIAWSLQKLAWRLRAKTPWPRKTFQRDFGWRHDSAPLKATGQELATEMGWSGVRVAKRGLAALVGLYIVSVCALAANAWVLKNEVGGPERWLGLRNAKIATLVEDRRGLPMGTLGTATNSDATLGEAVVPDSCLRFVLYQEDRHHADGWRRFGGVDLLSATKLAFGARGASTLAMQMARLLDPKIWGEPTLQRKRLELASARHIESMYGGDMGAMAADYLRIAPMAIVVGGGGSVDGLANFAATMFGKASADLSTGECAIAISALPSPILFNARTPQALARNDRAFTRALRLLQTQGVTPDAAEWQAVEARRGLNLSPALASSIPSRRWQLEMVRPLFDVAQRSTQP